MHPAKYMYTWSAGLFITLTAVSSEQFMQAKRQLPKDIPLYDKLLMSRKQLYQKYVKNRQRHGS